MPKNANATLALSSDLPGTVGDTGDAADDPAPPAAGPRRVKSRLRRRLAAMLLVIAILVLANIALFERMHVRIRDSSETLAGYVELYKLSRRVQLAVAANAPDGRSSLARFRRSVDTVDGDIEQYGRLLAPGMVATSGNAQLPLLIDELNRDWAEFLKAYRDLGRIEGSAVPPALVYAVDRSANELQASVIAISFVLQADQAAQLQWLKTSIYAIAAADFLIIGLIMVWLRRRVVEPVERISAAARRFASSDFTARVELAPKSAASAKSGKADEIEDLGGLFNQAAGQIQQLMSDIQRESVALREAETKFRTLSEQSLVGIYMVQDNYFVYVNPRFAQDFGYPVEAFAERLPVSTLIHPDDLVMVREPLQASGSGEYRSARFELRGIKADGSSFPVEVLGSRASYRGRPAVIGTLTDLTERKHAEQELRRINRTLQVLSACNHALVHAGCAQDLLDVICAHLVTLGGFTLAYICVPDDPEARSLRLTACAGPASDYARHWSDADRGKGNSGEAIRRRDLIVVRNIPTDPAYAAWREEAVRHHLMSSVAIPLLHGDETFGVLRIFSAERDAFNDEELALLNELADDTAYGLLGFKARERIDEQATELMIRQRAIETSHSGLMISRCDRASDNPIIYVNTAFENITGYSRSEVQGRNARFLIGDFWDQPEVERLREALRSGDDINVILRNARSDASMFWNEISLTAIRDSAGKVTHFISTINDVSDRIRYQNELQHHATHDTLTGLANRVLLNDRVEQALAHAKRGERKVGFLLIDLDRFKLVNESLGHQIGDELLRLVAERLAGAVRDGDTVARIAGDQFVVVLAEVDGTQQIADIAGQIDSVFAPPFLLDAQETFVSASFGICMGPDSGSDAETLLTHAEIALSTAKVQGGGKNSLFVPPMGGIARDRISLETDLRRGIERNELAIFYQPKVSLRNGQIVGAEALIRWHHPMRGLVPPMQFIPLAEETGLIGVIGDWVIEEAMRHIRQWTADGVPLTKVAVNLSARQFRDHELLGRIEAMLRDSGVDPNLLELELTESMLLQHGETTVATLHALRNSGFSLAIDDFGTGYSSLSYLQRFPIDTLKIDRSFVKDLETSRDSRVLAETILMMARNLGKSVVAEGVETPGQADILRRAGCEVVQGFLYSRPVPLGDFTELLQCGNILPSMAV